MAIKIYIAEDDPLLQSFLATILDAEPDFEVVGCTINGNDVPSAVARLRPHLLLMDIHLTGISGLRVLEHLGDNEGLAVLILSSDEAEETQLESARNGARGFLPKAHAVAQLGPAIRAVTGGQLWFEPRIVAQIFREHQRLVRQARVVQQPAHLLRDGERKVLSCVARGMTNPQIAAELFMSVHTVKLHIQNILRKLNLPNRTEAAVYAVREGLMDPPPGAYAGSA